MDKRHFYMLALVFLSSFVTWAQQDKSYYYYKGEKIFLAPDKSKISVVFNTDVSQQGGKAVLDRFLQQHSLKLSNTMETNITSSLVPGKTSRNSKGSGKTMYAEIDLDNKVSHEMLLKQLPARGDVLMVAPAYKNKTGDVVRLTNIFHVKLKRPGDEALLYQQAKEFGVTVLGQWKDMPLWYRLESDKTQGKTTLEWSALFFETGLFKTAEPNMVITAKGNASPNDPDYSVQWHLNNTGQSGGTAGMDIRAELAWDVTTGSDAVDIGIFDSGVELNHPDLQANIDGLGYDTMTAADSTWVYDAHGTWAAGVAGAVWNNNTGVAGVTTSDIVPISVNFNAVNQNHFINGFTWARNNGVEILNCSWKWNDPPVQSLEDAITDTLDAGVLVVFASGNDNTNMISYPASIDDRILVVGGINDCGTRHTPQAGCDPDTNGQGSQYGTELDLVAGGRNIGTTSLNGLYNIVTGTSFAAPQVAGVAALIWSLDPSLHNADVVREIIEKSARKISTNEYNYVTTPDRPNGTWHEQVGYGLLDAAQAVYMARGYYCEPSINIATDVPDDITDYRKSSSTLTATNTIPSNSAASYGATEEVVLTDGFTAENGAEFVAYYADTYTYNCWDAPNKLASKGKPSSTTAAPYDPVEEDMATALPVSDLEEEKLVDKVKVYPNPSSGIFKIKSPNSVKKVSVVTMSGNMVGEFSFHGELPEYEMNLSHLPNGLYLVYILTENGTVSRKIIKQ